MQKTGKNRKDFLETAVNRTNANGGYFTILVMIAYTYLTMDVDNRWSH